jgi:hypothetical protein
MLNAGGAVAVKGDEALRRFGGSLEAIKAES